MKKMLITMAMMLPMLGFAQGNGGIANENTSLKLEYVSTSGNTTVVKVTNKDTCDANMNIQWGSYRRQKAISSTSSDTFQLQNQTARYIQAYSISPCRSYLGVVEINYISALPIRFKSVRCERLCLRSARVTFEMEEETTSIKQYNIQMSTDGVTFKTISVIIPEGKTNYSTIVNFN